MNSWTAIRNLMASFRHKKTAKPLAVPKPSAMALLDDPCLERLKPGESLMVIWSLDKGWHQNATDLAMRDQKWVNAVRGGIN